MAAKHTTRREQGPEDVVGVKGGIKQDEFGVKMGASRCAWHLLVPLSDYHLAFQSYLTHTLLNSLRDPKNLTVTFLTMLYLLSQHMSSINLSNYHLPCFLDQLHSSRTTSCLQY